MTIICACKFILNVGLTCLHPHYTASNRKGGTGLPSSFKKFMSDDDLQSLGMLKLESWLLTSLGGVPSDTLAQDAQLRHTARMVSRDLEGCNELELQAQMLLDLGVSILPRAGSCRDALVAALSAIKELDKALLREVIDHPVMLEEALQSCLTQVC